MGHCLDEMLEAAWEDEICLAAELERAERRLLERRRKADVLQIANLKIAARENRASIRMLEDMLTDGSAAQS